MTSQRVPGNWARWNMKTGPQPGSGHPVMPLAACFWGADPWLVSAVGWY